MQCLKKKNNKEKHLEISLFYTCVPKTTIIWGMVPELWSEKNIIFCHFGPFFFFFLPSCLPSNLKNQNFEKTKNFFGNVIILQMCTKNHNHTMYASWDMETGRHTDIIFCDLGLFFLPFYSTNEPKNLEKR